MPNDLISVTTDKKAGIFLAGIVDERKKLNPIVLRDLGRAVNRRIKEEINRFAKSPTGKLARSFRSRVERASSQVVVASNSPYSSIHETGGVIRAKPGSWLRFKGDRGWATVKQVRIRRKRYLSKALGRSRRDMERVLGKRTLEAVQRAARKARRK